MRKTEQIPVNEVENRFGKIKELIAGMGYYQYTLGNIEDAPFLNGELEKLHKDAMIFTFDELCNTEFKNKPDALKAFNDKFSKYIEQETNGKQLDNYTLVWRRRPEIMSESNFETNEVLWGYYARLKILPIKVTE